MQHKLHIRIYPIIFIMLLIGVLTTSVYAVSSPSVMVVIDEKNLGTIPTAEVEALAIRLLRDENLQVMDQDMVRANLKKDQNLLKMAGDVQGAAALGTQFGADIVLTGEAVAKPSARRIAESNLRTYQAVVTLRAIATGTSETLASASETASVIGLEDVTGGSKSLKAAGNKTLKMIIPEMMDEWERVGDNTKGTQVVLTVGGVDQVWKLKAIRQLLKKDMDCLNNVIQDSYTTGAAVFSCQTSVPTPELSERLILNAPDGLKIQVLNIDDAKISLRVVQR